MKNDIPAVQPDEAMDQADETKTSQTVGAAMPGNVIKFPASDVLLPDVELTEDGIAEDFASRHKDDRRFDHNREKWFVWRGTHWEPNSTNLAFDDARRLARKHRGGNKKMATKVAVQGIEYMARSDQRLAVTSETWDRDPFLLGTPGGTVNLKTGELQVPKREDFITKTTAVIPAPNGTPCPTFLSFLEQATGGDKAYQRFIQQLLGYCLTGDTREQSLAFIYGPGGNGKTVLLNVVTQIMGDYAIAAPMQTFVATKYSAHPTELAMLDGARLVTAAETDRGQEWSESRINLLTGNEPISARFMRQDFFTFIPTFKLIFIGNHKPKLGSVNEAAKRRFNILPFVNKPDKPDKALPNKLREEYPAILSWIIDGCLDWQANGLAKPSVVQNTTAEYFEEQDLFGRWLAEECDVEVGKQANATALYESWKDFADKNGEEAGAQASFSSMLVQGGFQKKKTGVIIYVGIAPKKSTFGVGMNAQL